MLMPDAASHLGAELQRAVNRMDFFRLFKFLAGNYDCQYFALAELLSDEEGLNLRHVHTLHNLPEAWIAQAANNTAADGDPVSRHLKQSTVPCSLDLRRDDSEANSDCDTQSAIVVPLHTMSGKRYGLVLFGTLEPAKHQRLASIALDAAVIFQRYFEVILSLDSITGLGDRELQIVRWTSEGKTSAEIAIILGLSEHTVNSYIAAILRKLHVVNRTQMVASALRSGLIT